MRERRFHFLHFRVSSPEKSKMVKERVRDMCGVLSLLKRGPASASAPLSWRSLIQPQFSKGRKFLSLWGGGGEGTDYLKREGETFSS